MHGASVDVRVTVEEPKLPMQERVTTPERATLEVDELSSVNNAIPQLSSQLSRSSRSQRRIDVPEEVTESPRHAPGSGRRQALGSEPAPARAEQLQSDLTTPTPLPVAAGAPPSSPTTARGRRARRSPQPKAMHTRASPELDGAPAASTTTPRVQRRKEEENDIDELSPDQPHKSLAERYSDVEVSPEPKREEEEEEEEQEASEIPDAEAAKQLQSRRHRKSSLIAAEAEESDESSAEEDEGSEIEVEHDTATTAARAQTRTKRPPTKASPAHQRAPKGRKSQAPKKPARKKDKKATGPRSNEVIPVTTYRMMRGAQESDDDLALTVPFPSRSGVNAVDVLGQMCEETVASALESLEQGALRAEEEGSVAERREYRTKLRAVEAWGEELRCKLMEVTISLDAEYAMRKRVRAAMREKIELRTELLRIRRERERVALRMDGVRIRHEEEGRENEVWDCLFFNLSICAFFHFLEAVIFKSSFIHGETHREERTNPPLTPPQSLTTLSTSLHSIALAASLGRDASDASNTSKSKASDANNASKSKTPLPLPLLLAQISALASTASHDGGLLRRLRDFNAFLERVAGAVEGG